MFTCMETFRLLLGGCSHLEAITNEHEHAFSIFFMLPTDSIECSKMQKDLVQLNVNQSANPPWIRCLSRLCEQPERVGKSSERGCKGGELALY